MRFFNILFLCTCLIFTSLHAKTVAPAPTWTQVVEYARINLPLEGTLKAKSDGYVYLKVDDRYIYALFPMLGLEGKGYKEPPYFRSKEAPGAHISVMYGDEHIKPSEVGKTFRFSLEKMMIVKPSKGASYVVLQVHSPELAQLRVKYGLSPKLHGHEYHITIAKKVERKR